MIKALCKGFITSIVVCTFIFGSFWIIKNISYFFFYESLTIKTIQTTVKAECLNEQSIKKMD